MMRTTTYVAVMVVMSWWGMVGMGQQPPTAPDQDTMTEAPSTPADADDAYGDAYDEPQPGAAATQSTSYPAPQRTTGHGAWTEPR